MWQNLNTCMRYILCIYVCACVHACVEARGQTQVVPQEQSILVSETRSLTGLEHTKQVSLAGQKVSGIWLAHLPSAGISSGHCHSWSLYWLNELPNPDIFYPVHLNIFASFCKVKHKFTFRIHVMSEVQGLPWISISEKNEPLPGGGLLSRWTLIWPLGWIDVQREVLENWTTCLTCWLPPILKESD